MLHRSLTPVTCDSEDCASEDQVFAIDHSCLFFVFRVSYDNAVRRLGWIAINGKHYCSKGCHGREIAAQDALAAKHLADQGNASEGSILRNRAKYAKETAVAWPINRWS